VREAVYWHRCDRLTPSASKVLRYKQSFYVPNCQSNYNQFKSYKSEQHGGNEFAAAHFLSVTARHTATTAASNAIMIPPAIVTHPTDTPHPWVTHSIPMNSMSELA
jgi:hypothetical protein